MTLRFVASVVIAAVVAVDNGSSFIRGQDAPTANQSAPLTVERVHDNVFVLHDTA